MGSLCALSLEVLGLRTEDMAIPLDPLSPTEPELGLGVHTPGALHALSPTVLRLSPCGHAISHASECGGGCQGRQGFSHVLFIGWCPRCENLLTSSLPYWAWIFFSNSLDLKH